MVKLVVKLPFHGKSLRSRTNNEQNQKQVNKKTSKERVARYREKLRTDPKLSEKLQDAKMKKLIENRAYRLKVKQFRSQNKEYNEECKAKERNRKQKLRERNAEKLKQRMKKSTSGSQTVSTETKITPANIRKRAERVRKLLPKESEAWAETVSHIIKNATPKRKSMLPTAKEPSYYEEISQYLGTNKTGRPRKEHANAKKHLAFSKRAEEFWRTKKSLDQYRERKKSQGRKLSKPKQYKDAWKSELTKFLEENSRVMPNKKDTILIDGTAVPKRHLLSSKVDLYNKFKKENPMFQRKFVTFLKMIPKNYKNLDLKCRRVCVCTKCYNMEQQVEALNKVSTSKSLPELKARPRDLSNVSVCPYEGFPNRSCTDRTCNKCGTVLIQNMYQPLIEKCSETDTVKYKQWQTVPETYYDREGKQKKTNRWVQVQKTCTVQELVAKVATDFETFPGHLFRIDYQHKTETALMSSSLPLDHCIAVMDFSENVLLQAQDEIESAHWTTKQVTLHPIYLVRHTANSSKDYPVLKKESFIILSDYLTHNANAVFVFTNQLILHLKNNPGPSDIKVIHRFSDNCAQQYKCNHAFDHISQLQKAHDIKIIYHFTESGHGKGPSDGLGAVVKKKLERMILGGKIINNAYQAYLALCQKPSEKDNQHVIYLPARKIKRESPPINSDIKTVKGTQTFHMVKQHDSSSVLVCQDLSCSCNVCIAGQEGPCYFSQYRNEPQYHSLSIRKQNNYVPASTPHASSEEGNECNLGDIMRQSLLDHNEHLTINERCIRQFSNNIANKGWKIRGETPEDGNCLFWVVSDQLDQTDAEKFTQAELRHNVVKYMQDYSEADKTEMSKFLTQDVDTYLENMGRDGTYADHICMQALSKMMSCKLQVVQADLDDIFLCPTNRATSTLILGYLPQMQHYVSLEPIIRLKPEDFVSVVLSHRRRRNLYLAKVLHVESDGDVQLRFLQTTRTAGVYTWPDVDDISWQPRPDILKKLKPPELLPGRGLNFKFDLSEINESRKTLQLR